MSIVLLFDLCVELCACRFHSPAILRPSSLARTRDLNILYSSMGIKSIVLLFDLYVVLCACRGHKVPGPSQG